MGSRTGPSGRGAGADGDSAWEQRKLEARKMPHAVPSGGSPQCAVYALLANFALWLRFLLFKDRFPYNLNDAQDKQYEENRRQNAFDDCG